MVSDILSFLLNQVYTYSVQLTDTWILFKLIDEQIYIWQYHLKKYQYEWWQKMSQRRPLTYQYSMLSSETAIVHVNDLRFYLWYTKKGWGEESTIATQQLKMLEKLIQGVNYQATTWQECLKTRPEIPRLTMDKINWWCSGGMANQHQRLSYHTSIQVIFCHDKWIKM